MSACRLPGAAVSGFRDHEFVHIRDPSRLVCFANDPEPLFSPTLAICHGGFAAVRSVFGNRCTLNPSELSDERSLAAQPTFVVERPGKLQFPPAAALITAGKSLAGG